MLWTDYCQQRRSDVILRKLQTYFNKNKVHNTITAFPSTSFCQKYYYTILLNLYRYRFLEASCLKFDLCILAFHRVIVFACYGNCYFTTFLSIQGQFIRSRRHLPPGIFESRNCETVNLTFVIERALSAPSVPVTSPK